MSDTASNGVACFTGGIVAHVLLGFSCPSSVNFPCGKFKPCRVLVSMCEYQLVALVEKQFKRTHHGFLAG